MFAIAAMALTLGVGCAKTGPAPAFPAGFDPAKAEAEARSLSDEAATLLSVASALDDEATVEAGARAMAACKPGPEEAACKAVSRANAVGAARPRREGLKAAVLAQHEVAKAIAERDECRAKGDLVCVAKAYAKVAKALPGVLREAESLKGLLTK